MAKLPDGVIVYLQDMHGTGAAITGVSDLVMCKSCKKHGSFFCPMHREYDDKTPDNCFCSFGELEPVIAEAQQ